MYRVKRICIESAFWRVYVRYLCDKSTDSWNENSVKISSDRLPGGVGVKQISQRDLGTADEMDHIRIYIHVGKIPWAPCRSFSSHPSSVLIRCCIDSVNY